MDDSQPEGDYADEDRKADAWAVLTIFTALVLGAVHFMSGWKFDF